MKLCIILKLIKIKCIMKIRKILFRKEIDPFLVDMFAYGIILYLCLTGSFFKHRNANSKRRIPIFKRSALLKLFPNRNNIFKSTNKYAINDIPSPTEILNNKQTLFLKNNKLQQIDLHFIINESIFLITKLLNTNPRVRPRAGAILNLHWLKNGIEIEKKFPSMNSLFF